MKNKINKIDKENKKLFSKTIYNERNDLNIERVKEYIKDLFDFKKAFIEKSDLADLFTELKENILDRYNNEEYWNIEGMDEKENIQNILDRYNDMEHWDNEIVENYINENFPNFNNNDLKEVVSYIYNLR